MLYGYKFEGDLDGFFLGLKSDLAFTPNFGLVAGYRVMVDPSVDLNLSSFAEGNFFTKDEGFQEFDIAAYYNINANSTLKLGYHAIRADFDSAMKTPNTYTPPKPEPITKLTTRPEASTSDCNTGFKSAKNPALLTAGFSLARVLGTVFVSAGG